MSERSLQVSEENLARVKQRLRECSLSQGALAEELGMSRDTTGRFFRGQTVDRSYFEKICEKLGYEWEEVVVQPPAKPEEKQNLEIDALVQEIRETVRPIIKNRCGTMQVLGMSHSISLIEKNGIYTGTDIIDKSEPESGLEAVRKYKNLMVLGKPGAGKTIFLHYLAMQCIDRELESDRIPIFIELRELAQARKELISYVDEFVEIQGASRLLSEGRFLILLDGLDEVLEKDTDWMLQRIKNFYCKFSNNQFVITCRISAKNHSLKFHQVEIADFGSKQIEAFARSWFRAQGDVNRAQEFLFELDENESVKKLSANPLLLTLLCCVFESNDGFPGNLAPLYEEAVDIFLQEWDANRQVERDVPFNGFTAKRKKELLSKVALVTFNDQAFAFERRTIEDCIDEYISSLPEAKTDLTILHLESKDILKLMISQGLLVQDKNTYSFSHSAFQEYFVAREISKNYCFQVLIDRVTEKRWYEVFLLTVEMLQNAEEFLQLLKNKIDELIKQDKGIQRFLTWVNEKSLSSDACYQASVVRAFYFVRALKLDAEMPLEDSIDLVYQLSSYSSAYEFLSFDVYGIQYNTFQYAFRYDLSSAFTSILFSNLDFQREYKVTQLLEPQHACRLLHLMENFRNDLCLKIEIENFEEWWRINGEAWTRRLNTIMTEHRSNEYDLQLTEKQQQLLRQYYDANILLLNCLSTDCKVSREVRWKIEETLLLPIAEIKKHQQ